MEKSLVAVINTRGPNCDDSKPMEGQVDWRAHADFMNGLAADGFVLLGGPFKGTRDVLLIVPAADKNAVEARLAPDCRVVKGLPRNLRIEPWELCLGSLGP
jgi:uncharacterized protein YciI